MLPIISTKPKANAAVSGAPPMVRNVFNIRNTVIPKGIKTTIIPEII